MSIDNETAQRIGKPEGLPTTEQTSVIRSLLELHDYEIIHYPRNNRWVMWHNGKDIRVYWTESSAVEYALIHFLNDKAQTDARIADMLTWTEEEGGNIDLVLIAPTKNRTTQWEARRGMLVDGKWHDIDGARGDTPKEAVNAAWLKVHGLEDPRKQVTA